MFTQSKSYITKSREQADRVVDWLRSADFSEEEISVLIPEKSATEDSVSTVGSGGSDPPSRGLGERNILVSVHLEAGSRMGRAEKIFARSRSETAELIRIDDESRKVRPEKDHS